MQCQEDVVELDQKFQSNPLAQSTDVSARCLDLSTERWHVKALVAEPSSLFMDVGQQIRQGSPAQPQPQPQLTAI